MFVSSMGIPGEILRFHPMKFYAIVNFRLRTNYVSISFIESVEIRKKEKRKCKEENRFFVRHQSVHFLLK